MTCKYGILYIVKKQYKVKAKIWLYQGPTPWHFVTIDKKTSADIKENYSKPRRGFGSVRVEVTLGKTIWRTSVFPTKDGVYILPLKLKVRRAEDIFPGETITFKLEIL